jgi:hypothetical protein
MTTTTTTKPTRATVRRGMLKGKKEPDALATLSNTCTAGAQCTVVQNDEMASKALGLLQSALTTAQTSGTARDKLGTQFLSARRTARLDFITCRVALMQYEVAVGILAKGNAAIINKAGLLSRDQQPPAAALDKVTTVKSKPGKHQGEAIVSWSPGPGATSYAIEVNFTPQNPNGTWTALNSGSGRRRVVKAPAPGAQFLVRIASIGSDGSQAEWSTAILATAL